MEAQLTDGAAGTLYVVSTPIGNLGDITLRAIETLKAVRAVLAEDTRHSRHLLERYEIVTPLVPHHEHNEARGTAQALERLRAGDSLALISDAGTPLLSDPGSRLVAAVVAVGIRVVPIPGASALLAALVGAGLAMDRFTYFGFLARKGDERRSAVQEIAALLHASVLYEAPPRLSDTLGDLAAACGAEREAVVARELTKQFEEFRRGTLGHLAAYYREHPPRGEIVIVVAGADPAPSPSIEDARTAVANYRQDGLGAREIVSRLTGELGITRNLAYKLAHE